MAAIPKPKTPVVLPRAIRARDAIGRLLRAAAEPDPRSRQPWPARDLALIATFCVTGIREAEAVGLDVGSRERRTGRPPPGGASARAARPGLSPSMPLLDQVLSGVPGRAIGPLPRATISTTRARPCSSMSAAGRLTVDQVRYLVDRLYVRAGIRDPGAGRGAGARPAPHLRDGRPGGGRRRGGAAGVARPRQPGDHPPLSVRHRARAAPCHPGPSQPGRAARRAATPDGDPTAPAPKAGGRKRPAARRLNRAGSGAA